MIRLGLVLVLFWQTTSQTPTPGDALARAEAKWQANKPAVYEFTIQVSCFLCSRDRALAFRVTNGQPASLNEIDPTTAGVYSSYDTIDELFAVLKPYASVGPAKFDVQYHQEYGFPVSADLDRSLTLRDDELAFKVSGFKVVRK